MTAYENMTTMLNVSITKLERRFAQALPGATNEEIAILVRGAARRALEAAEYDWSDVQARAELPPLRAFKHRPNTTEKK